MKIESKKLHIGDRFSENLYFDDGKNLFLGAGCPVKPFHLSAIKRWFIPYLVTEGMLLDNSVVSKSLGDEIEELESVD